MRIRVHLKIKFPQIQKKNQNILSIHFGVGAWSTDDIISVSGINGLVSMPACVTVDRLNFFIHNFLKLIELNKKVSLLLFQHRRMFRKNNIPNFLEHGSHKLVCQDLKF